MPESELQNYHSMLTSRDLVNMFYADIGKRAARRFGLLQLAASVIFSGYAQAQEAPSAIGVKSAAAPSCTMEIGVPTADTAWNIDAWEYPNYPDNICTRRLPMDNWFGNFIGHPLVSKLVGDFSGDGCDQDVIWRIPTSSAWILNKGLGGTEVIDDGDGSFAPAGNEQLVGTYPTGNANQEGVVWSNVSNGVRTVHWLNGDKDIIPDEGPTAWLTEHPMVTRFTPTEKRIVAIGDSFTRGFYSDPLANFRERLWQQLFDFTTCGRAITLDWVGSITDYDAAGEPLLYGNNFFIDKEHEGHGGYHSCHINQCMNDWMDGKQCLKNKESTDQCAIKPGDGQAPPYTPDIALLLIGMNDLLWINPDTPEYQGPFHNLTAADRLSTATENVLDTLTTIRTRNPDALLLISNLPGGGNQVGRSEYEDLDYDGNSYAEWRATLREYLVNKNFRRYNYAMQQAAVRAASDTSHVVYVDQYSDFVGEATINWDQVHPNYAGHQQIADGYARDLAKYWSSSTACALPDLSDIVDTQNNSFIIADMNGDGCAQDIAYRHKNGETWSDRWSISLAQQATTYDLALDATGTSFAPGDLQQFVAAVDFDNDGKTDIIQRQTNNSVWHISFGEPNKAALSIADTWQGIAPAFDLSSEDVIVAFCDWGGGNGWLGWTAEANSETPRWNFAFTDGSSREVILASDWRESGAWLSRGMSAKPACRIIGNH